jgi:hypothetical protein
LENTGTTSDAAVCMLENGYMIFHIAFPAVHGADFIALPDAPASGRIKVYPEATQVEGEFKMFNEQ